MLGMLRKAQDDRRRLTIYQKERSAALAAHLVQSTGCLPRAMPLGTDRLGRRYWHFANMDDGRVWVEQRPRGHPLLVSAGAGAQDAWTWGFYHEVSQVQALLAHLDASGADAKLREALGWYADAETYMLPKPWVRARHVLDEVKP